ncbi:uncharacterized protein LOC142235081 [Haematobia irritans]|uniref:uncharacterized protein LOC142235081 n=1 Tax=Haematobia irritans TaxID=7368 RepID=UPI003F4F4E53
MLDKYLTSVVFGICLLVMWMTAAEATNPVEKPGSLPALLGQCGTPSEQILRCLNQWSCQHAIRLDLRCLLNLNGVPLLGGLLGGLGGPAGAANAAAGGGAGGGAGNIVSSLLGRR